VSEKRSGPVRPRAGIHGSPDAPDAAGPRREEYLDAVEAVSRGIQDPVAKLRYLRGSVAKHERQARAVSHIPLSPLRRILFRWMSLEALAPVLASRWGVPHAIDASTQKAYERRRLAAVCGGIVVCLAVSVAAWQMSRRARALPVLAAVPGETPASPRLPAFPVAETLPDLPAAVQPAAIWQVEKGDSFELYSNGLRIETAFQVAGEPRSFQVFLEGRGLGETVYRAPVGLLFHTSESDVWPLDASFNENLRDSSQRLLKYVSRNKLYHFLIDRFGRVWRVVDEQSKANHAGHSVWADGGLVYLNLNHAFLGISFETRWEGGRALPITQAQLAAGRNLTDLLRQKYEIAPRLCTAHGLTSVNPKKRLIGHHMDWARGFPFAAFGLPDQYARAAPSVAVFGFGYDDDFIKVMGEPWPGVSEAESGLAVEAERRGLALADLRREKQQLYDTWFAEQASRKERVASEDPAAPRQQDRPSGGG
jgi:hypothetical protein